MRHWVRPAVDCARDLERVRASWPMPEPDAPQPCRGELRLAAEVAVAELRGQLVPTWVHERAFETLNTVAFA